LSSLC